MTYWWRSDGWGCLCNLNWPWDTLRRYGIRGTISDFRKRHLHAMQAPFTQVLNLAVKAGLSKIGHVALDKTKVRANASKHKAMSYGRMRQEEACFSAEV